MASVNCIVAAALNTSKCALSARIVLLHKVGKLSTEVLMDNSDAFVGEIVEIL